MSKVEELFDLAAALEEKENRWEGDFGTPFSNLVEAALEEEYTRGVMASQQTMSKVKWHLYNLLAHLMTGPLLIYQPFYGKVRMLDEMLDWLED